MHIQGQFETLMKQLEEIKSGFEEIKRPPNEVIYDSAAVCRLLNCSNRTLADYRRKYQIVYSKCGSKLYYTLADVLDFIQQHRVEPGKIRIPKRPRKSF